MNSRKRFVRINYRVKNFPSINFTSPTDGAFEKIYGRQANDCRSSEAYSIYLIEPRLSNKEIYEALDHAWRQSSTATNSLSKPDLTVD